MSDSNATETPLSHFYEITRTLLKKSAKLRTSLYAHRITFKNVNDLEAEETQELIYNVLEEIFNTLTDTIPKGAYIRLAFKAPSLAHPVNLPYMKVDEINLELVMSKIASVLNSNEDFELNGCEIYLQETQFPAGSGNDKPSGGIWKKRRIADIDEFIRTRQRYIIPGPDRDCLPMCVALGSLYHQNRSKYRSAVKLKYTTKDCKNLADSMLLRSGISPDTTAYSIEEISKLQSVTPYRLIVIGLNDLGGPEIMFAGPEQTTALTITLFLYNQHFHLVNSVVSAFMEHLCLRCLKFYATRCKHNCTKAQCKLCSSITCTNTSATLVEKIDCTECGYTFKTQKCYLNHLQHCKTFKICKECGYSYCTEKDGKKHNLAACKRAMSKCCQFCGCVIEKGDPHTCFIEPAKPEPKNVRETTSFVYIDSETRVKDNMELEPVLLISQTEAGVEQHYWGADCYVSFIIDLVKLARQNPKQKYRVFAHYAKGFENLFMMEALLRLKMKTNLLMRGSSILRISLEPALKIGFFDSFLFVQQSLANAAKTMGVDAEKGRFPFGLLQQSCLDDHLQSFPEKSLFWPHLIKTDEEMNEFNIWYEQQCLKYKSTGYNVRQELIHYASNDVTTLRLVLQKFDDLFDTLLNVRPLLHCTTLQEAVMYAYRKNELQSKTVQMIPYSKGLNRVQFSNIACKWLEFKSFQCGHFIEHARNGGEKQIALPNGGITSVDGFCSECNTIFEFYGCYFHSCQSSEHSWNRKNPQTNPSFQQRKDRKREELLRSCGHNVVTVFECVFHRQMKEDAELQRFLSSVHFSKEYLKPADSIVGGRCEAFSSYYNTDESQDGKIIKSKDFNSLYPSIYSNKLPAGECKVVFGLEASKITSIDELHYDCGLLLVELDPPRSLVIPVIPYKSHKHNKLVFGLCSACMESTEPVGFCEHNKSDRRMRVTLTLPEIRYAVNECGYKLHSLIEAWLWESSENLFGNIQRKLYKWKLTSSEYPTECETNEDKQKYLEFHAENFNIQVKPSEILPCSATRQVAKSALTAFWGKFIQKTNLPTTKIISEFHELSSIMFDETKIVNDAILLDAGHMIVQTQLDVECEKANTRTACHIGAHILGYARIKLHSRMKKLPAFDILYVDTDSIIFKEQAQKHALDEEPGLGQLQNEFGRGEYAYEFGSTGQKSYYCKIRNEGGQEMKPVVKLKGFVLNQTTKTTINMDAMKQLITGQESQIVSAPTRQLKRRNFSITQTDVQKTMRMTNDKRLNLFDCLTRYGKKPSKSAKHATVPIGFCYSEQLLRDFIH